MKEPHTRPFRIVFMGTPEFAIPALKALIDGPDNILAVVTQPDKPRGRGRRLMPSPVKEIACAHNLDVYQPAKVKDKEFLDKMATLAPDLLVVCAYGQILPQELLDIPKIMPINIHGSLLPKYRGAAPIQWAILNGEEKTGITIMKMDAGMDTGPMLLKKDLKIGPKTTYGELSHEMAMLGADALMEALDLLQKGKLIEQPQPNEGISYAPPIKKEQIEINWDKPANSIHCHIRAFDPKPGAYTFYEGNRIRLFNPEVINMDNHDLPNGTLLDISPNGLVVACNPGVLKVEEIQWPGKKRMSIKQFLCGKKLDKGKILGQ